MQTEHGALREHVRKALDAARVGPAGESRGALESLFEAVRWHIDRENRALYPVCDRLFGPFGVGSVMRTDHERIEAGVRTLLAVRNGTLQAKLRAVATQLEGHFAQEERVLFPMLVALMSRTDAAGLARELSAREAPRRVRAVKPLARGAPESRAPSA